MASKIESTPPKIQELAPADQGFVAMDSFEQQEIARRAAEIAQDEFSQAPSTPAKPFKSRFFGSPSPDSTQDAEDNSQGSPAQDDDLSPHKKVTLNAPNLAATSPQRRAQPSTPPGKTPTAVTRLLDVIDKNDPKFEISPTSQQTVDAGIKNLAAVKTPTRDKLKTRIRERFGNALTSTGTASQVSPSCQRRLLFASTQAEELKDSWTTLIAQTVDVRILDEKHLQDLENDGGFHICPAGHPRDSSVHFRRTNIQTGVWCGKVFDSDKPTKILKKFSSFIPRTMTKEQYDILIANALNDDRCKIASEGNRRLYRLDGKGLLIEMYFQENGTIIRSAIPQFHYEVYRGKEKSFTLDYYDQFSLNDPRQFCSLTVKYQQLFELLLKDPAAALYKTDDKIIVDVGILYDRNPKYGCCPIAQGLLVEIERKFLV